MVTEEEMRSAIATYMACYDAHRVASAQFKDAAPTIRPHYMDIAAYIADVERCTAWDAERTQRQNAIRELEEQLDHAAEQLIAVLPRDVAFRVPGRDVDIRREGRFIHVVTYQESSV